MEQAFVPEHAADVLMSLAKSVIVTPSPPRLSPVPTDTDPETNGNESLLAKTPMGADGPTYRLCVDNILSSADSKSRRVFGNDFLHLSHDRALNKEAAFHILTQTPRPNAPCRSSASPIDRRTRFFYVTSSKIPGSGRGSDGPSDEISVSFQSIANSEPWWSDRVCDGNRLGIVARHMSRRTRVQGKAATESSSTSHGGNGDDFHGFQGRWFCLVQAPCHLIGGKPAKLKLAKPVPGAYSLVQVWRAPGSENGQFQLGKRKHVSPRTVTAEQIPSLLFSDEKGIWMGSHSASEPAHRIMGGHLHASHLSTSLLEQYPVCAPFQRSHEHPRDVALKTHLAPYCFQPQSMSQDRLLAPSRLLPHSQQLSDQTTFQGLGPAHAAARKQALRAPVQDTHPRAVSGFSRSCSGGGGGNKKSPWPNEAKEGTEEGSNSETLGAASGSASSPESTLGGAAAGVTVGGVHPRIYTYSKADEESDSGEGDSGDEVDVRLGEELPLPAGPASQTAPNFRSRDAGELKAQAQTLTQTVSTLLEQLRKEQAARERLEQLVATHMVAPQGVLPNQQQQSHQQQQQQQQQQCHLVKRGRREQESFLNQSLVATQQQRHQPEQQDLRQHNELREGHHFQLQQLQQHQHGISQWRQQPMIAYRNLVEQRSTSSRN